MFRRWQQYRADKTALPRILGEEVSGTSIDSPFVLTFGLGNGIMLALVGLGMAGPLAVAAYDEGLTWTLVPFATFVATVLVTIYLSVPMLREIALTVSWDGVRMRRWFGETYIPWSQCPLVAASRDLLFVRIESNGVAIAADLRQRPGPERESLVRALRAWTLSQGYDVIERAAPNRLIRTVLTTSPMGVGVTVLIVSLLLFTYTRSLGIRCSTNGPYFQETLGTPERSGCAVLTASGAAEGAGMVAGDLIIAVNEVPITSGTQFTIVLREMDEREYRITAIRGGQVLDFDVGYRRAESLQVRPDDPLYYFLRGRSEAADEKFAEAATDYSKAIELAPDFDLAYLYRAQVYDSIGAHDSAYEDFLKAIELSPSLGEAHRLFGIHERSRDLTAANFRIRKAIELDGCHGAFEVYNIDCAEDYYQLGVLQANSYDVSEPIATAEQATRFWPNAPEPYCLLATLYERAGDQEQAVAYALSYLDFADEDRYPECEADARRIAVGASPSAVVLTPSPTPVSAPASGEEQFASPPPTNIGTCIDFSSETSCAP